MVEDKYIGLLLALSGSTAIGSSFIVTKKGLNDAAERHSAYENASEDRAYLQSPVWWLGMTLLVVGEVANFAAYTFAPPILVTPLGASSVLIGAVLASIFLKEELGHLGRIGCTLCLAGSLIIVLHAPEDKDIQTVDEILHYAIQPGFMLYFLTSTIFSSVMIFAVSPKYGHKTPVVWISICSVVGSLSIMAIKGLGIALKLTFSGNNQLTHPSTYVFAIVVAVCIAVQMNYFNKALDLFSTNVVNPMYYVMFTTATIVASLILFQGFNTSDVSSIISLLVGFVIIFLGVHLLNLSRKPDTPPLNLHHQNGAPHLPLENGFTNPRLSLSGRLSVDSTGTPWNVPRPNGDAVPLTSPTHRRRASGGRGIGGVAPDRAAIREEREAEELFDAGDDSSEGDEDDESDADETTQLRSSGHTAREAIRGARTPSRTPTRTTAPEAGGPR